MSYLIDTNAWIAFFENAKGLTNRVGDLMEEEGWECYISKASIWEAAIKVGLGKLKLPYDIESDLPRLIEDNGFQILDLTLADITSVRRLEAVHGDPFDRIQIVQARRRQWRVVSRDGVFDRYGLHRIWD